MTLYAALSFVIAVFIFSVTPGPGVFAIMARALVSGARSCFWLSLGMCVGDICYLIAACLGLAAIATHWGEIFALVRLLGAGYLFYLGWKMWRMPISGHTDGSVVELRSGFHSAMQGFLISASNPKVILFYIAFLPTFIDLSVLAAMDILIVSVLTLMSLMAGLSAIAWTAAGARRLFESEKAGSALNKSAGVIMMSAGAFLLLRN